MAGHNYISQGTRNGSDRHKDANVRWIGSSCLVSGDVTELQATAACSSLGLIKVKHKSNKQSSAAK